MNRLFALAMGCAAAISGCTYEAVPNPGQKAQLCEQIGGGDRFVVDPSRPDTKVRVGIGTESMLTFTDRLTGRSRTMLVSDSSRYRCKAYEGAV
jgi:hypothetical protein